MGADAAERADGGAPNVGWLFISAREGGMDTFFDAWPAGSSPVKDGHNDSEAIEHPESKIAAPRTAHVDLRKFTLPDRRSQKTSIKFIKPEVLNTLTMELPPWPVISSVVLVIVDSNHRIQVNPHY
jgi:hypothetical protein|tara:strand:- start:430 stop:807 length:378 start_codon:yes stop_codon:yes gene_type:complete